MQTTNVFNLLKNLFIGERRYDSLEFTPYAWAKINSYIYLVGGYEVTGMGKLEKKSGKENDYLITDIAIFKQTVRSAYVECNIEAVETFIRQHAKEIDKWQLDWHSHVEMSTGPSGTDTGNYEVMQELRMGSTFPFLIINKQGSITAGEYMGASKYNNIKVTIPKAMDEETLARAYKEAEADVQKLCTVYVAPPVQHVNQGHFGGNNSYYPHSPYYNNYDKRFIREPFNERKNKPQAENVPVCKNCGAELADDEIQYYGGFCEDCLDQANIVYSC